MLHEIHHHQTMNKSEQFAHRFAVIPTINLMESAQLDFTGFIGKRILVNQENWLLHAPFLNPAMLQIFRDQDLRPRRELVRWAGEFPGKYLISAVQGYRLTRDRRLKRLIKKFVCDLWILLRLNAADGRTIFLCDFATAGAAGTNYRTWLPISNVKELSLEKLSPFNPNQVQVDS